jgi:hypothetical protein
VSHEVEVQKRKNIPVVMKRKKGVNIAGMKDEFGQGERVGNHGNK